MTISQELQAGALYFQKNIPDIILIKTDVSTPVIFELKKGADVILSESYVFDVENKIQIRNIGEIVEKYLSLQNLLLDFSYTITQDAYTHDIAFSVLKCEADMTVDPGTWTAQNFLTRSYTEKRTSKSRNEYLSFLHKPSYGAVTPHFKIKYYSVDHWAEATGTLAAIAASTENKITTINTSMGAVITASGLDVNAEILLYEIWITGTEFETNNYTFLNDFNIYRNRKHFVFVNSFGVLETFTATGRSDVKKSGEFNLGNIQNRYRKISQDFISETVQYSGFLWESEMEWIDDLLLSYNVSTYTPGVTGSDEEITLTGFDKTDTDANELEGFSFTYRKAKNSSIQFVNAAKGIFDATFDNTFN